MRASGAPRGRMTGGAWRRDDPARPGPARPADGLLHPVVLGAVGLLAVNDQVLKAAAPGPLTWILSDVAGLIVAPLALQAGWEVLVWALGRWHGPSGRVLAVAVALVAIGFTAVQLWPPATDAYRVGLGLAQWPFRVVVALALGQPAARRSRPCWPSATDTTCWPCRPWPSAGGWVAGGWTGLRGLGGRAESSPRPASPSARPAATWRAGRWRRRPGPRPRRWRSRGRRCRRSDH